MVGWILPCCGASHLLLGVLGVLILILSLEGRVVALVRGSSVRLESGLLSHLLFLFKLSVLVVGLLGRRVHGV